MKFITVQHYNSIVKGILKEKERQAEALHQEFSGLTSDELKKEVDNHIGDGWALKKEEAVKFSKSDINAVAGARFFRQTGRSLLMGLAIVVLGLAVAVKYMPIVMTELYYTIYYALIGLATIGFLYVYTRKQSKVRKELWRQIGREESLED